MKKNDSIWISKSVHPIWKQFAAMALLSIYFFVNSIPLIHLHADDQNHEVQEDCCEEVELDPCHRLIVHHDAESSCNHEIHLSEQFEVCDLCDVTLNQKAAFIILAESENEIPFSLIRRTSSQIQFESKKIFYKQLRGPPSFIS